MHPSAYLNAVNFYNKYCFENIENKTILDVGSYDVNGTLKPLFEKGKYIGVDMEYGPNVNLVIEPYNLLFKDNYFDIIVSTSCFEHDEMFWLTFNEMARVLKPGGYIYICAPSSGPYHAFPLDCWRFYLDSWGCLAKWATRSGYNINLIESYIDPTDQFQDSIGIFTKIK